MKIKLKIIKPSTALLSAMKYMSLPKTKEKKEKEGTPQRSQVFRK